jgi:hypothetical protein
LTNSISLLGGKGNGIMKHKGREEKVKIQFQMDTIWSPDKNKGVD